MVDEINDKIKNDIKKYASLAFKVSVYSGYPTEENIHWMIKKASREGEKIASITEYLLIKDISKSIKSLCKQEHMIDTRNIESALKVGDLNRARNLLTELKNKYQEYKDTIEELETYDDRKSSLATRLADGEIDKSTYDDAAQSLERKKSDLEEKLNRLRKQVIHEDYEKPF